ncbi:MAG: TetR family transcriptional regulator C-terminal domain-containing protein [Myxococcales bacterium]|nr:TetR family transcriptional regulator C-terminal domain-containing protein [Myxococcales bacterium]
MARTKDPLLEEERRAHIAEATIALLSEQPWKKVTLSAVADRAGVSRGVVTYWFADKAALMLEALEYFHRGYAQKLVEMFRAPAPIERRLNELLDMVLPDTQTVSAEVRFQVEIWSYAKQEPKVLEAVRTQYKGFSTLCRGLLQAGASDGSFSPDAESYYPLIHALIDGISLHLAFDPSIDLESVKERLTALIQLVFRRQ